MKLTAENYKLPCTSCLFVLFMLLKCAHTNKSNSKVLKAFQGNVFMDQSLLYEEPFASHALKHCNNVKLLKKELLSKVQSKG